MKFLRIFLDKYPRYPRRQFSNRKPEEIEVEAKRKSFILDFINNHSLYLKNKLKF